MPLFSSQRERRLWAWVLAVVVAIYATLGLARTLADALAGTRVGDLLFAVCLLLALSAIATQGLVRKPGRLEIGVALGVATVYVMVFARMATETERSHLFEYGLLAFLVYEALGERRSQGRRVPQPALLAVVATVLVGTLDEVIQLGVPSRVFDAWDIGFNALAATMAVAASATFAWARRRQCRAQRDV